MTIQSDSWISLSDVARRTGMSVSSVSRRVASLERDGLLSSRMAFVGAPKLVNIDDFLAVVQRTTNGARSQSGAMGTPAREARRQEPASRPPREDLSGADLVLSEEQARKTKLQADLAQIQLDKARGFLIPVADVEDAMTRAGGRLARALDALPARADEFAAVVAREGAHGLRAALKAAVREFRERLAADMTAGDADGEG